MCKPRHLIGIIVLAASAAHGQSLTGRVVGVSDGDTITVLDAAHRQHKIRLTGIDAPESGQSFGTSSKKALSDCAFGKQAAIEGDKLDRYGRTLGKVVVGGVDCNLRQISLGLAWHFKRYASERPRAESDAYAAAETAARNARHGLWADAAAPTPPWDWRSGGQQAHAASKEMSGECACATGGSCSGKRGGEYCLTPSGTRKYVR